MSSAQEGIVLKSNPSGVNPDIQKERDTATFNVRKLINLLDGGEENTHKRKELEKLVYSEPDFDTTQKHYLNDGELYEHALRRGVKLYEFAVEQGMTRPELQHVARLLRYDVGITVHGVMFIPAIERMGTEEQQAKWLPKALSLEIIGTYAQTEMGHGTNLRNLETTAVYDSERQEFVLNTPFPSGMKWWPGGLGKTTNHAIVLATLYIKGRSCGMQGFMVQLRDTETHRLLPGVETGSIGPRFGIKGGDSGYLILRNVRIPRNNMLMKNAKVSPNGTFSVRGSEKANYGTMIMVRAHLVGHAKEGLSQAVTVATRYSSVRRQSELTPGGPEPQVLDFQTQQYKIFPYIAAAYAFHFAHRYMLDTYDHQQELMWKGNYTGLPELHVQSSGLKAFCTDLQMEGIESCRRSCGGHGFLLASGLCDTYCDQLAGVTVEGENTVLYLQVARYLMKTFARAQAGEQLTGGIEYLSSRPEQPGILTERDCHRHPLLVQAFHCRAYGKIAYLAKRLQSQLEAGKQQHLVWNQHSVQLVDAAKAHVDGFVMSNFVESLQHVKTDPAVHRVLNDLCTMYGLHRIVVTAGEFLETGAINLDQLDLARQVELKLLDQIRPDAVSLVDAFDWDDRTLNSVLGCYDGNVYPKLYEWAKKSPINKEEVHPAFYKYIRPFQQKSKL